MFNFKKVRLLENRCRILQEESAASRNLIKDFLDASAIHYSWYGDNYLSLFEEHVQKLKDAQIEKKKLSKLRERLKKLAEEKEEVK